MIECAHVFMPLVTPTANKRLWVQQEIGYANALQVPVCPIAIGEMPAGMNSHIQGVHITGSKTEITESNYIMKIIKFKHDELQTTLRIRLLVNFINIYKDDEKLRVVIPPPPGTLTTNLNIAGDWFATEAVVPLYGSAGYERTMFTRHAPTVLNMIDRFDQDFRDCLPREKSSRHHFHGKYRLLIESFAL